MALREEFVETGNWLFQWRSYIPVLMLVLMIIEMKDYESFNIGAEWDVAWDLFCLAISMFGLGIRIFTVGHTPYGTSGRNTETQVAEFLNSTGIYSTVRHPLYLGNFFMILGPALFAHVWWFTIMCIMMFVIFYERVMFAEEDYLRNKFSNYDEWASTAPPFIPNFKNYVPANLPFSLRNVLKREYSSFFGVIASFFLLVLARSYFATGTFYDVSSMWIEIFLVSMVIYLTLRTMNRKTNLLNVEGR